MGHKDDDGTDAASIKPVSSLLSHFEGLKADRQPLKSDNQSKETSTSKLSLDAPRPSIAAWPSSDVPRPASPWSNSLADGHNAGRLPSETTKGRSSPTRTGHQKSSSIQMITPLAPAVTIDSPKSPPQTFFERSASRSPERVDNTPFSKVRELISQHSSRASTRPSTPGVDADVFLVKPTVNPTSQVATRSNSPLRQPPPINRADKPKIPAKPPGIGQVAAGTLTPDSQSRRPSVEARISPFSTPPSSGDNSPTESPGDDTAPFTSPFSPAGTVSSSEGPTPITPNITNYTTYQGFDKNTQHVTNVVDPRHLGFTSSRIGLDRKDPRTLGFSSPSTKADLNDQGSVTKQSPGLQAKPAIKDARDSGFSTIRTDHSAKSELRETSSGYNLKSAQNPMSSSQSRDPRAMGFNGTATQASNAIYAKQNTPSSPHEPKAVVAPSKDARHFGFNTTKTSDSDREELRPTLPARRNVQEPPPRPSETSKPSLKQPARSLPPKSLETSVKAEPPAIAQSNFPASKDVSFPPPPKRNTFNEDDAKVRNDDTKPLRRATTDSYQPHHEREPSSDENEPIQAPITSRTDYPDATQANRRPPFNLSGEYEINARADPKVLDISGRFLCVTGYVTRVFDMETGDQVLAINHGDTVKMTAVKFKPGSSLEDEGKRLWLGNNLGELLEIDVGTQSIIGQSSVHNRREIVRIIRHQKNLITLDDDGKLFFWKADYNGAPNIKHSHTAQKTQRGHTFSIAIGNNVWLASGKEIRIYCPGNDLQFNVVNKALSQPGTGDVTSGTFTSSRGGRVFFGHTDGRVTIYSSSDYSFQGSVKISDYKITGLAFVGDKLWASYKTGKVYVYDISVTPWKVKKDWPAHNGPVYSLLLDPSSVWNLQRLQIITAGHDNLVRLWDATLQEDWIENAMQERDVEYCTFRELTVAVISWNVGAIVPAMLRNDFIADAIHPDNPPDVIIFGFQEVVDLEDRAITAKSLLGFAKKKDTSKTRTDQQYQSRVYREWRDYLARCLSRFTNSQLSYSELHMSSLVGLFQCIFIRSDELKNATMLSATNVKCGMGGHYGNKGALVTRFVLDDSSLCFINCHLAAGQTQTSHRNNDVATILESESLGAESNRQIRSSLFVGGGDGTQILDHEICVLNGDLNYRIDTIPRDTVIKMIRNNELTKLLERDQLLVSRKRVSGFRLSSFTELPLLFAPTYKYDPGTDNYDSSEKRRSPAWCDRILYRGPGRIKQIEYRRHEVKVSDHRPVSGIFKIRIKRVNATKRQKVMDDCYNRFATAKKQLAEGVCVRWLVDVMDIEESQAQKLIVG